MYRPTISAATIDPFALPFERVGLVVAAAGYEPRATAFVERLRSTWGCEPRQLGRKLLLLEFESARNQESRRGVDRVFSEYEPVRRLSVTKEKWRNVQLELSSLVAGTDRRALVAVDYSCMSRMLYLSLVPLVYDGFQFVFSYSIGKYSGFELDYPLSAVGTIRPVPGFEGLHYARPNLHVIGLGYDGVGTAALVDRLEATRWVTFWADPGASDHAASIAVKQNESLIERGLVAFSRDLRDVPGTADILGRLAFEVAATDKVVFVPVGPKPQILACALAAAPHEHCSVLAPYLGTGGIRDHFPPIESSGEFVGTAIGVQPRSRSTDT